jgi:hypothetical protein
LSYALGDGISANSRRGGHERCNRTIPILRIQRLLTGLEIRSSCAWSESEATDGMVV